MSANKKITFKLLSYPSPFSFIYHAYFNIRQSLTYLNKFGYKSAIICLYGNFVNDLIKLRNRIFIKELFCPCCGWSGNRFLLHISPGYYLSNSRCPNCYSLPRHRAMCIFLLNELGLKNLFGIILHFSPSESLRNFISFHLNKKFKYFISTYDYSIRSDFVSDLMFIPVKDSSVDFIICLHILEHIKDDLKAIRELWRIIKPNGKIVLMVPIDMEKNTEEYKKPNRLFDDHFRYYGKDFMSKLFNSRFKVRCVEFNNFIKNNDLRKYGLKNDYIFICEKRLGSRQY